MNKWISNVINEIEAPCPRKKPIHNKTILKITLKDKSALRSNVAGNVGCYIVRCIYSLLGFDEYKLCRWRLEHKLVQSTVFRYYLGRQYPKTIGLNDFLKRAQVLNFKEVLNEIFPKGYIVKRALSESSGDNHCFDLSNLILNNKNIFAYKPKLFILDEEYIVQEKIKISREFRVHSIESNVIPTLTMYRYHYPETGQNRCAEVNRYVQSLLNMLPKNLLNNSMLSWDIAETVQGKFRIVEINITGFHQQYLRGFQCSGFFQDQETGPIFIAHLIMFIRRYYNFYIDLDEKWVESNSEIKFLNRCKKYLKCESRIS